MDLRRLEYFVAVGRDGTFTAAAERLHVAQPALWKQVRDLEAELGLSLLERVGRRVRLTTDGGQLLERAEQLLAGADRLRRFAVELRDGQAGRIRIGCYPPHIMSFLSPVIAEFRTTRTGVNPELVEYGTPRAGASRHDDSGRDQLIESLLAGATDVVMSPEADDDGIAGFRAYEVSVVAVAPPSSPLGRRRRLDVSKLRDVPLVVSPRGFFSRSRLEVACRAAGFEPRIEVESSSPAALLALSADGAGTAVLADDTLDRSRHAATVITSNGQPLSAAVFLYRRAGETSAAVNAFVEVAKAHRAGKQPGDR